MAGDQLSNREISDLCVRVAYSYPLEWLYAPGGVERAAEWQRRWMAYAMAWLRAEGGP